MQPTVRLLKLQFRARMRLVTNAVSFETLTVSDFLSHRYILRMRRNIRKIRKTSLLVYSNFPWVSLSVFSILLSFLICHTTNATMMIGIPIKGISIPISSGLNIHTPPFNTKLQSCCTFSYTCAVIKPLENLSMCQKPHY